MLRGMIAVALAVLPALSLAAGDSRLCGPPERTADGRIRRSVAERARFMDLYPCPQRDAVNRCLWIVDHVIPLACGGCDAVENMQWLPRDLWMDKSTWERRIYGGRGMSKGCP